LGINYTKIVRKSTEKKTWQWTLFLDECNIYRTDMNFHS